MASLPKGSTYAIPSTFGAPITVTNVTNASSAVCTAVGHGLLDGDVVEFSSGWSKVNRRIFKVDQLTADTFALVDCDSSNIPLFPAGSGVGSVKKLSGWTQIPKVMNPSMSGGEPKNVVYEFVEDENEYTIFNGWSAMTYTLEIDDDTTTAGYAALVAQSEVQTNTVLRILKKGGVNPTYIPCTVAINTVPVQQEGQIDRMRVQFSGRARPTRYTGTL